MLRKAENFVFTLHENIFLAVNIVQFGITSSRQTKYTGDRESKFRSYVENRLIELKLRRTCKNKCVMYTK
mgnify:CR=1 FL=1